MQWWMKTEGGDSGADSDRVWDVTCGGNWMTESNGKGRWSMGPKVRGGVGR